MMLKKLYKSESDDTVVGVRILNLGAGNSVHFTPDRVAKAIAEGWMVMTGKKLVLNAENGKIMYSIVRTPGYYCCHCKKPLSDGGLVAQMHVTEEHDNGLSPDPSNPSGYERINYLDCVEAGPRPEGL